jgi:hypothetical protein
VRGCLNGGGAISKDGRHEEECHAGVDVVDHVDQLNVKLTVLQNEVYQKIKLLVKSKQLGDNASIAS